MRLHIETICQVAICGEGARIGILRGGDNFEQYGDEFSFSAVVIIEAETLRIKGLIGKLPKTFISDIKKLMRLHCLKTVIWERIKNNKITTFTKDLT